MCARPGLRLVRATGSAAHPWHLSRPFALNPGPNALHEPIDALHQVATGGADGSRAHRHELVVPYRIAYSLLANPRAARSRIITLASTSERTVQRVKFLPCSRARSTLWVHWASPTSGPNTVKTLAWWSSTTIQNEGATYDRPMRNVVPTLPPPKASHHDNPPRQLGHQKLSELSVLQLLTLSVLALRIEPKRRLMQPTGNPMAGGVDAALASPLFRPMLGMRCAWDGA